MLISCCFPFFQQSLTPEDALEKLQNQPENKNFLKQFANDEEFFKKSILIDPSSFEFANDALKGNKEYVAELMKLKREIFEYAAAPLKLDVDYIVSFNTTLVLRFLQEDIADEVFDKLYKNGNDDAIAAYKHFGS